LAQSRKCSLDDLLFVEGVCKGLVNFQVVERGTAMIDSNAGIAGSASKSKPDVRFQVF
jgi:hypothetical protein